MTSKKVNVAGLSLTEEDIKAMKDGVAISGSLSGGIEQPIKVAPSTSHPIRGYGKDIRPNIAGNRPNENLVTNVSPAFAGNLARQAQEDAREQLKRLEEEHKAKENLSNQSLRRDVEALRRHIKRLEKQLKEITDAKTS